MALYEHLGEDGEVDEIVRPVPRSKNERALAAKARDEASGWRLAKPAEDEPAAAAPAPTPTKAARTATTASSTASTADEAEKGGGK